MNSTTQLLNFLRNFAKVIARFLLRKTALFPLRSSVDQRIISIPRGFSFQSGYLVIIGLGIFYRLIVYLSDRSLWLDEAIVALKVLHFSFGDLIFPYGDNADPYHVQGAAPAPVGFFVLLKAATLIFGEHELVLRFFPFFSGILAVIVFKFVADYFLKSGISIMALSFFAVSSPLIYFSAELKPYSTDLLMTLLLYLVVVDIFQNGWSRRSIMLFGVGGAFSVFFSMTAILILLGTSLALFVIYLTRQDSRSLQYLQSTALIWGVVFVIYYFWYVRYYASNPLMAQFWYKSFFPLFSGSFHKIHFFMKYNFHQAFKHPVGLAYPSLLAHILFWTGCCVTFFKRRDHFWLLFFPILITLLVSALHKYPYSGRLILFLVPSYLLLIFKGLEWIIFQVKIRSIPVGYFIGFIVIIFLFTQPIFSAGMLVNYHIHREELKPVLQQVQYSYRYGDKIYIYGGAQKAFRYYQNRFRFIESDLIWGAPSRQFPERYHEELQMTGVKNRVWFVFSHIYWPDIDQMKSQLHDRGILLQTIQAEGARAFLYDLTYGTLQK